MVMGNRKRSSATGFLAELIIVIFFLIASSAVITQAYAGAESIRTRASDLNSAMMATQNLAEAIRALDNVEALDEILSERGFVSVQIVDEAFTHQYLLAYNEQWQEQASDSSVANWDKPVLQGRYLVVDLIIGEPTEVGVLIEARLTAGFGDEEIFSLDTARFIVMSGGGS